MRKVKLNRLILVDWRGRTVAVEFSDNTEIRGYNGSGKSTLFDAFNWLLTGYDSENRKNYDLFDNTVEFTYENATSAVVEGELAIDGCVTVLKRTATPKWRRERGSAEYVKAPSDEYKYYIDGLSVSAKVYTERIEALFAPIDILKLILNVRQYLNLEWKDLRKQFAVLTGEVEAADYKEDYSPLQPLVSVHKTFDAVKDMLRQKISPMRTRKAELKANIDGKVSTLPDLSGVADAERTLAELRKQLEDIDKRIAGLGEANEPIIKQRNTELAAIADKKREISDCASEWLRQQKQPIEELEEKRADIVAHNAYIQEANKRIEQQKTSLQSQLEMAKQQYDFYSEERDRLYEEKERNKAKIFDENQVCSCCGQPLPSESVAEIRAKFYAEREEQHKRLVSMGVRARDMRDSQAKLMSDLEKQIVELPPLLSELDSQELEKQIIELKATMIPFENTDKYKAMAKEMSDMESCLTEIPEVDATALMEEKQKVYDAMNECLKVLASKENRVKTEQEIAADRQELSKMAVELAHLEGLYDMCIQREREWAAIIRERANRYMTFAHVEMVELSTAGVPMDICTVTVDGVDAKGSLNTAHKILAGIDISCAFQRKYDICMPIFIDNSEMITIDDTPALGNQTIRMYADVNYPQLSVV